MNHPGQLFPTSQKLAGLRVAFVQLGIAVALLLPCAASGSENSEHVIVLHGMWRTSRSMKPMERTLAAAGYQVRNVSYPSRSAIISELSEAAIGRAVEECLTNGASSIHFVTHSLGGILVRDYLSRHTITNLGRVVMLGPPNGGSELVEKLHWLSPLKKIVGPASVELGTDTNSPPFRLGAATFPAGIIAGNRSLIWLTSLMIPGPDDGTVSVERTKLAGMSDHLVLPVTHNFIMLDRTTRKQTVCFLREGRFDHESKPMKKLPLRSPRGSN